MEPIRSFSSTLAALPLDDIDTDQIIPARYLKVTDKAGLGEALFSDWRYDAQGRPKPDFPLNRPELRGARVLVAGRNFGCGSSREHAPWALLGYGFRAVVSTAFADIFRNNAVGNGLLPVALAPEAHGRLLRLALQDPAAEVRVSLEDCTVTLPDGSAEPFPINAFDRHCLLEGVDRMGFLLATGADIGRYEAAHPATFSTLAAGGAA
jgi:3-isopropylmalate/(R)-2-methylmalate dehydratase small subunit